MSRRFQSGSLFKVKRKGRPDAWVFRFYEQQGGKRVYRKQTIGTVDQFPLRRDAEKEVASLRTRINFDVHAPQTVSELIEHYEQRELPRKAFASQENHKVLVKRYIKPKWGEHRLSAVRTIEVEQWLDGLTLAPASKTKIKGCFSVLYSHAIRHQWTTFNPISKVRTSSKRLRERDILTPREFQNLLQELSVRDRAMVLLAGSTGLRRSELIALTWDCVNEETLEISVRRSCVAIGSAIRRLRVRRGRYPCIRWCWQPCWIGRRNRATAKALISCSRPCVWTARSH